MGQLLWVVDGFEFIDKSAAPKSPEMHFGFA
jgi:hypothetical protein